MARTVVIDPRYDGFAGVAYGGYVAGVVAQALGGSAMVRFRRPAPTGRALELEIQGDRAELRDGPVVLVEAGPWADDVVVPDPPTLEDARRAAAAYSGRSRHPQPTCFGCGPDRAPDDGMHLAPGSVDGRPLVATPWTPPAWTGTGDPGDPGDVVDVPFVWAALDCPSAWAHIVHAPLRGQQVTASLAVHQHGPVRVGEPHIVVGWVIDAEGTERIDGAAVVDGDGQVRATARARWVARAEPLRPS